MAYVDFDYYVNEFKGVAITAAPVFDSLCVRAEAYVNAITFGRIEAADEGVKNAVCAVCETLNSPAEREGISSESNDGYSVTYVSGNSSNRKMYAAAALFLPAELLYRGF